MDPRTSSLELSIHPHGISAFPIPTPSAPGTLWNAAAAKPRTSPSLPSSHNSLNRSQIPFSFNPRAVLGQLFAFPSPNRRPGAGGARAQDYSPRALIRFFSPFFFPPAEGEEFYEASPYEPVTSRLSDIFRLASIFSGNKGAVFYLLPANAELLPGREILLLPPLCFVLCSSSSSSLSFPPLFPKFGVLSIVLGARCVLGQILSVSDLPRLGFRVLPLGPGCLQSGFM